MMIILDLLKIKFISKKFHNQEPELILRKFNMHTNTGMNHEFIMKFYFSNNKQILKSTNIKQNINM